MSVVVLQLGQCGNQIGSSLFSTIMADISAQPPGCSRKERENYHSQSIECFFNEVDGRNDDRKQHHARAVMVDMEPKVIAHTLSEAKKSKTWMYAPDQHLCQKRGSGNNWAHGYHVHGPAVESAVMEMVRREVEKCDYFGGFLTAQSVAGGTGSGLGTYLNDCLREEFPHSFIMNQVVWPYSAGEVSVQNYNAVLTLSQLYQASDAILLMDNDTLHKICQRRLSLTNVSFQDINSVIAHQLASLLQPAFQDAGHSCSITNPLGWLLEHVASHADYKLLSLRSIPLVSVMSKEFSVYTWPGLLKHLRQMLIAATPFEEGINWQVKASRTQQDFSHSLANLLVLRGHYDTVDVSPFSDPYLYPSWMPSDMAFKTSWQPQPFNNYEKCATLLSNGQAPVGTLDSVISKAWQMFAARAYVHQYTKHGLTEEHFVDSFACLEQVLANYKAL